MATYKVALVQLHLKPVAPAENFAKAASFIKDAASKGCHLAVLPEYHLSSWAPEDPAFIASCADAALYLSKYQELAKELNICIVPGTILERHADAQGESLHNVAYFISSTGEVLGRYQKKNLWHPERRHLVSSAHEPHVAFDTPLGRVGLLICWDLAFPEAFRELISDGAEIIVVPSFWTMKDVTDEGYGLNPDGEAVFLNSTIVSRAYENTCAVLFVNTGGPPEKGEKTNFAGLSQLSMPHVGALGKLGRAEGMSIVDMDMNILKIAEDNYKVREDMQKEGWHYAYTRIRDGKLGQVPKVVAVMTATPTSLAALTTIFTPPSWCADRYAVFIATPTPLGAESTGVPSSGWIDRSFSSCIPAQYTNTYPTFSPGVCPGQMTIVSSTSNVQEGKTIWTGACCQSGFSTMTDNPQWLCTSSVTTPMAFLLVPDISTADIYTTLSSLWIEHDQLTVQWREADLTLFPSQVTMEYASMMGVATPTTRSARESSASSAQPAGATATTQPRPTQPSSQSDTTALVETSVNALSTTGTASAAVSWPASPSSPSLPSTSTSASPGGRSKISHTWMLWWLATGYLLGWLQFMV